MAASCTLRTVTARLTDREIAIPYWEVVAATAGPTLTLCAAQHGNEVQGAEVIRRLRETAVADLRCGRLLLCPMLNLPAVRNRRPHLCSGPETPYGVEGDGNINRTWPGDSAGGDTSRLTHALFPALIAPADALLDFHCWPATRGSTVLATGSDMVPLARATALRFVRYGAAPKAATPLGSTVVGWMRRAGRSALCIELSGQYMIQEHEVRRGLRAAMNVCRHLGLMPGAPEGLDEPMAWLPQPGLATVAAPHAGLFAGVGLRPSDRVEAGQLLGHVLADDDLRATPLLAPISGLLATYGRNVAHVDVSLAAQHPFVAAGDVVAEIAVPGDPPA